MKRLLTVLTCTILALSLSSCSAKKEEPAPEPTQTQEEDTRTANDFDTREHFTVNYGDYILEVPSNYRKNPPYYYVENTGHNDLGMLYLLKDDSTSVPSYELLAFGIEAYITGFVGSMEDGTVTDRYETTVNDIPMYVLIISGTVDGREGVIKDYIFVNPSDYALMSLIFMQENTTVYDHFPDFDKIVASIRPAE